MVRVADLYRAASRVRRTEGTLTLLRRAFSFALARLVVQESYYLAINRYEGSAEANEEDVIPPIRDLTFRAVMNQGTADELEAEGFQFRSYAVNPEERLGKGAVALCIWAGRELAAIVWIALSQEAKDCLAEPPAKVDFQSNEAWIGGVWSHPKYRRMGLSAYRSFKIRQFVAEKGITATRACIARGNVAALSGSAKRGDSVYAKGRYLRILWWKSWKETPLSQVEAPSLEDRSSLREQDRQSETKA